MFLRNNSNFHPLTFHYANHDTKSVPKVSLDTSQEGFKKKIKLLRAYLKYPRPKV